MQNVALIGYGYWGPNLARNFMSNEKCNLKYIVEKSYKRLKIASTHYPNVNVVKSYEAILQDRDVDIIVIATPVDSHYELGKLALENGKHIWVEKPFTACSMQADTLIKIASEKCLKIFVDHTFLYTGAVRKMKSIISNGDLGEVLYFDSVRINLGLFQKDVNVIWDLAPHDISIMYHVINKPVKAVAAHGIANYYEHENIANLSVYFEDNCYAHFHVNWTSPVKVRKILVGGDKKMLMFDDLENSEKLKIYDAGVNIKTDREIYDALADYRLGDMYSPKAASTEAIAMGVEEFVSAIEEDRSPMTDGHNGKAVVQILEAADHSLKNNGIMVDIG